MGKKTQPKKPVKNGQSITKFCFKKPTQVATTTDGPASTAVAAAAQAGSLAAKALSRTTSSTSSGNSQPPRAGSSTATAHAGPVTGQKADTAPVKHLHPPHTAAAATAAGGAAAAPLSKRSVGQNIPKFQKRNAAAPHQQHLKPGPPNVRTAAASNDAAQKRQAKQDSRAVATAVPAGPAAAVSATGVPVTAKHAAAAATDVAVAAAAADTARAAAPGVLRASSQPAAAAPPLVTGSAVAHAATAATARAKQPVQLRFATAAAEDSEHGAATRTAAGISSGAVKSCKRAHGPRSTAAAAAAAAAAKGAAQPPGFGLYGNLPAHGRQVVMSQFDDQMEINWEPSPPKLSLAAGGSVAAGEASAAAAAAAAATAASTGSRCTASKSPANKHQQQQQHSRSGSGSEQLSDTDVQKTSAAVAAAAAAGSDELLQQLLGSLSAEPPQHDSSSNATVLTTPGGPRLRAFRHHSVVPPPSTGGGSTVDGSSTGGPRRRRPGSALGTTAAVRMGWVHGGAAAAARGDGTSSSSVKRQQAGVKRKVLLDLLEKVEVMVKRRQGEDGRVVRGDDSPRVLGEDSPGVLEVPRFQDLEALEELQEEDAVLGFEGCMAASHNPAQTADQEQLQHKLDSREHQGRGQQQQQQQQQEEEEEEEQQQLPAQAGREQGMQAAGLSGSRPVPSAQQQFATPPPRQTYGAALKQQHQQQQLAAAAATNAAASADAETAVDMVCKTPAAAAAAVDHVPETPVADAHVDAVMVAASPGETPACHCAKEQQQQHQRQQELECSLVGASSAAADKHMTAAAAASGAVVISSQEVRALAAAKELEEFALLYGEEDSETDMEAAVQPDGKQHAQQQPAVSNAALLGVQEQQQQPGSNHAEQEAAPTQQQQQQLVQPAVELCGGRSDVYHIVLEVLHDEPNDVQLRCFNPYKGTELWVHLSHPWCDCLYAAGDAVNVIGGVTTTDAAGRPAVFLNDSQGLLVLHPDILLSGTSITTALSCTRKAWLSERFAAAGGGPSAAALQGTLLHELLQRLLVDVAGDDTVPLPGVEQLHAMVDEVLSGCGAQLQEVGLTEAAAAQQMSKHLANISGWLRKYLPQRQQQQQAWQQRPEQQSQSWQQQAQGWQQQQQQHQHWQQHILQQQQQDQAAGGLVDVGPNSGFDQPPRVLVEGVADIEENIWAPRYGLKGQLDASLLVRLTKARPKAQQGSGRGSSWGGSHSSQGSGLGFRGATGSVSGFSAPGPGILGSGWSEAGSGRAQGAGGGLSGCGGGSAASGGGFGSLRFQHSSSKCWPAEGHQQQQQQRAVKGPDKVLMQRDLNTVAATVGVVSAQPTVAAAAAVVTGACGITGTVAAAAAAANHNEEPMKVFKGRLSGAAAAICAVTQQRQQQQQQHRPELQQQQQQQQPQCRVLSLAAAPSRNAHSSSACHTGTGGGSYSGPISGMPVQQQQQQQQQQSDQSELHVMPFEFKSGKEYFSHRAQVSLYLLLMEARYDLGQLPAGLLWNVHSQRMALVASKHGELAALLACRNRLAAHLWQDVPTPPRMLGNADACARCHSAAMCAAVHAVVDGGSAVSSGMSDEQWSSLMGSNGVGAAAAAWGSKCLQLIDWEEAAARASKAEMWALTGAERQAKGRCIAGLQLLCSHPTKPNSQSGGEQLYLYTFRQLPSHTTVAGCGVGTAAAATAAGNCSNSSSSSGSSKDEPCLQGMPVSAGDCLILGADGVQANVGRVDVVHVQGSTITVACRKALQLERYSSSTNRTAAVQSVAQGQNAPAAQAVQHQTLHSTGTESGALDLTAVHSRTAANASAGSGCGNSSCSSTGSTMLTWRLDKDEAASSGMQQRANVLRVAADSSSSRVVWLRRLIIDLDAPKQVPPAAAQQTLTKQQQTDAAGGGDAAAAGGGTAATAAAAVGGTAAAAAVGGTTAAAAEGGTAAAAAAAAAMASLQADASVGAAVRLAMAAARAYLQRNCSSLNSDQVGVLRRVLQMQDYTLVLGMPGTGKTSTIVHAIRALVAAGASVLVTSYTNSALDNILLKLVECGVHEFVRIGRQSSCHPGVQEYLPGSARYPQQTTTELQQLAASTPIVGCPCLSVHHPLLAARPAFDVVIVDEAGQISLPAILGALLKARSFVLVGDHYQLPPLVLDKRAAEGGLGVSLFRQLCEAHPAAMVVLAQQYRMCRAVMGLANELVYGGQLVAGSKAVEAAMLELPKPDMLQQCPPWVAGLLAPACQLAFINTDTITPAAAAQEEQMAGRGGVVNAGEAALLMQLLDGLLACGVPGSDIGMVSPYKAQVTLLQQLLAERRSSSSTAPAAADQAAAGGSGTAAPENEPSRAGFAAAAGAAAADVEVLTIDRCQGRDKAVLLLSFVRSNHSGTVGTLLSDWQRLNVAITRAKVKLVMVGSARTLRGAVPLFAKLLEYVQREGQLVTLPRDALQQQQQ